MPQDLCIGIVVSFIGILVAKFLYDKINLKLKGSNKMEILNKSQVDIINRIVKELDVVIEAVTDISNDCCIKVDKLPKGKKKEYGYNVISSLNGSVLLIDNAIENLKAAAKHNDNR